MQSITNTQNIFNRTQSISTNNGAALLTTIQSYIKSNNIQTAQTQQQQEARLHTL